MTDFRGKASKVFGFNKLLAELRKTETLRSKPHNLW